MSKPPEVQLREMEWKRWVNELSFRIIGWMSGILLLLLTTIGGYFHAQLTAVIKKQSELELAHASHVRLLDNYRERFDDMRDSVSRLNDAAERSLTEMRRLIENTNDKLSSQAQIQAASISRLDEAVKQLQQLASQFSRNLRVSGVETQLNEKELP